MVDVVDEGDPWAVWRDERKLLSQVARVALILRRAEAEDRPVVVAWARAALRALLSDAVDDDGRVDVVGDEPDQDPVPDGPRRG